MDHVQELRDEISAVRETPAVSPKDLLQLQDDFLALRSEQSALQSAVDAFTKIQVYGKRSYSGKRISCRFGNISSLCAVNNLQCNVGSTCLRLNICCTSRRSFSPAGHASCHPENILQLQDDVLLLRRSRRASDGSRYAQ